MKQTHANRSCSPGTGKTGWWLLLTALISALTALAAEESAKPENQKDQKKTEPSPEEAEPSDEESAATLRNWIDFGLGGIFLDGDQAQFQKRHALRADPYGGIEDFHWETQVGKKSFFELDGRALVDNRDYALRFELVRPDVGFFRGGYKQYRSYYDGSGGFFPLSGAWFALEDDEMALDRGEVWVEGGLTLPNKPQFTFKYAHQYRVGYKNSTSWPDSDLTSPGPSLSTPTNLRGFAPSFWDLDERRHTFQGEVKHQVGKTELGLGLRYEMSEVDNALKGQRRPGEGPALDRHLTSRQEVDTDLFNVRSFSETRLNEKLRFSSGYSFTTLETDLGGSRIYGDGYDVGYRQDQAYAQGYFGLAGGSQMDQHVFHLNLMAAPWTNLTVVPSLRMENLNLDSLSTYELTGPGNSRPVEAASARSLLDVAERLELRYTGLTNWVLYARGDWSQAEGDLEENGGNGPLLTSPGIDRVTDDSHFTQKYTIGANWYPLRRLNTDLQYYHKNRVNEYDDRYDSTLDFTPDAYPAFYRLQRFDTDDVNFRITYRPWNKLTLVTRYDFQYSRTISQPDPLTDLGSPVAAKVYSHVVGENLTWVPWPRLYLQASLNYAQDTTDTPANQVSPAVRDGVNAYWTASLTSGFVLDEKTDLQVHYFYYQSDNFYDNSIAGMPYGYDVQEHGLTVTLARKLSKKVRLTLKYGYFQYRDAATDGHNDYDAHLVYSGLQYRF